MHPKTQELYSTIEATGSSHGLLEDKNHQSSEERNKLLENAYQGETAYIVTCGPSLKKVWTPELEEFLDDKLVISVKQAHDLVKNSDFHMYNEVRMKNYDYMHSTIRLSVSQFQEKHLPHIQYPIFSYKYDEAIFVTNDYERWMLNKSIVRPWGVGIMFELGLHLPVHLGCKKIVIIGFDMNDKGAFHYYDGSDKQDYKHYKVDEEEFGYAVESSKAYYEWCKTIGVDVYLYSPMSALKIPQINLHKFIT